MTRKQTKQIQERLNKILLKLNEDDDILMNSSSCSGSDSEIVLNKNDLNEISEISSIESIKIDSFLDHKSNHSKSSPKSPQKVSKIPIRSKFEEKNLPRAPIREQKPVHPVVSYSKNAQDYSFKPEKPINFFAIDFAQYEHAIVCIYKGTDFPRARQGERSTYVIMRLHDQLQELSTPISFDSKEATYNAGFKLDTLGLDFDKFTPVIEVYDFQGERQRELLGVGYIQLQMAKRQNKICTVLHDSWVNIYTVNTHVKCGRVLMTLIFYDDENDIEGMIKNPTESNAKVEEKEEIPVTEPIPEPPRPKKKESMAVQAEVFEIPRKTEESYFDSDDFDVPIRQNSSWRTRDWQEQERKVASQIKQKALDESTNSQISFHKRKPKKVNTPPNMKFVTELDDSDSDDDIKPKSSPTASNVKYFTRRREKQEVPEKTTKYKYTSYADYGY